MNPEAWFREYRMLRYLRHRPDADLQQRLNDLAANIWSTDRAGKVIALPDARRRGEFLRLIADVFFEKAERTGQAQIDFDESALRKESSAGYRPPALKTPFPTLPSLMSKFGQCGHLADALSLGRLRIAPASSYDDPSLNPAQKDKELEHYAVTPNEQLKMKVYGRDANGNEMEIPVRKLELFRYMMVPDFYVWCCGLGYDARLFHEFAADAALIIHDQGAFCARLSDAVSRERPEYVRSDGIVQYYDPHTVKREQLVPIFSKHFRYAYQNEYRLTWKVPAGEKLKPFFVELGPLTDIAIMVELA